METYFKAALTAAQKASAAIMELYDSGKAGYSRKKDDSPLTLADMAAHKLILKELAPTRIPVISEESEAAPFEVRSKWEYLWLVDPLDGTKEFLNRNGEFTVNIALVHHQKPVWGTVCLPVVGKCFYGGEGMGAFCMEGETTKALPEGVPLPDLSAKGLRVAVSRSHLDKKTRDFVENLHQPELISSGSSIKFLLLAEGKADIYPRFSSTMEWDTAAAHAILKAVGKKILVEGSKNELLYNKPNLMNPGFLAL